MAESLLEVKNLKKYFKTSRGMLHAVDDITFKLERGKTLGIVGESGCGKSTTGRCVMRLIEPTSGEILFEGKDLMSLSKREMRSMRGDIQIVFQDPFSSLDPRSTVMQSIAEGVKVTGKYGTRQAIEARVVELMDTVGLAQRLINAYPHELDGGRRQRIGIARALAVEPKLIICDEPVSALDVSIQAQILNLLQDLQHQLGFSYIFITHDLAVVNHISDDIMVMYLGQTVEMAPSEELFRAPAHPYTKALLSAIPIPKVGATRDRILLKGEISSPIDPEDACRFSKRCNYAADVCHASCPKLREIAPGHLIACHRFDINGMIED